MFSQHGGVLLRSRAGSATTAFAWHRDTFTKDVAQSEAGAAWLRPGRGEPGPAGAAPSPSCQAVRTACSVPINRDTSAIRDSGPIFFPCFSARITLELTGIRANLSVPRLSLQARFAGGRPMTGLFESQARSSLHGVVGDPGMFLLRWHVAAC
jgi:hypothetical protein